MSYLQISNLQKSFDSLSVLKGVSLQAEKGEVIALLGSSGSGKSTLLRCMNLLEVPDAGSVAFAEHHLQFDSNKSKKIPISQKELAGLRSKAGMVFQSFNLWPHLTILENLIEAPVQVLKQSKQQAVIEAEKLLEQVGITDKKNAYPQQLSGGQQQRAAIARALMMQPEILLFDEPTSALDPEMVNEVLKVMKNLAAQGMTMLVATHEIGFAREVANQVIFLEQGKILEQGKAKEVLQHPQTLRFQQFLEAVWH